MAVWWPQHSFYGRLRPGERVELMRVGRSRRFGPGEVIYGEGRPLVVALVRTGLVKVTVAAPGGSALMFPVIGPGDIAGVGDAVNDYALGTASAFTDVDAVVMSQVTFMSFLNSKPTAWETVTRDLARRAAWTQQHAAQIAYEPVGWRLAKALLDLIVIDQAVAEGVAPFGCHCRRRNWPA
ncbi:Crp/Fnr family transcriptional regulator [Actinomadura rudentiformis]|uniref:Crp/Fnr family transcriptional regulator n=1 Tax=Actinomadura rudentiformis TaxID=359158 RepID=A0A6H9YGV8_9ACTN|nr:Crp/Fnr family transcriptional regulator [Actinomadura rudentiformis]KAB2339771.1 Crp/Fnr family transcriptional regulator [Actinomadura rudentiformis]